MITYYMNNPILQLRASQILPWSLSHTFLWIYYWNTLGCILPSETNSWVSYLNFKSAAPPPPWRHAEIPVLGYSCPLYHTFLTAVQGLTQPLLCRGQMKKKLFKILCPDPLRAPGPGDFVPQPPHPESGPSPAFFTMEVGTVQLLGIIIW